MRLIFFLGILPPGFIAGLFDSAPSVVLCLQLPLNLLYQYLNSFLIVDDSISIRGPLSNRDLCFIWLMAFHRRGRLSLSTLAVGGEPLAMAACIAAASSSLTA